MLINYINTILKNKNLKNFLKLKIIIISLFLIPSYGNENKKYLDKNTPLLANLTWEKEYIEQTPSEIKWEKYESENYIPKKITSLKKDNKAIYSLNRSIVFTNTIGPDISWLVPPGFKWNKKYKFDNSIRGYSRRKKGESFFGWNGGDAVGQFYYHFLHTEKIGFGLNMGVRSVYSGNLSGGSSAIGEGLSAGFRVDYKKSPDSGVAFGAEQLLHFDGLTDTGRDIYLTASKAYWKDNMYGVFPINVFTGGIATGKMAEGNVKGLCSDLLGGSGTEIEHQRRLCWAPVFSIARVHNESFSTFFEYNSKYLMLGNSIAPFDELAVRGTFGVIFADHINNYQLKGFEDLTWVFRMSLGF